MSEVVETELIIWDESYLDDFIVYGLMAQDNAIRVVHYLNVKLRLQLRRNSANDKLVKKPKKKKQNKVADLFSELNDIIDEEENDYIRYESYKDDSDAKRFVVHFFQNKKEHSVLIKELKAYEYIIVINDYNNTFPIDLLLEAVQGCDFIQLIQPLNYQHSNWINALVG